MSKVLTNRRNFKREGLVWNTLMNCQQTFLPLNFTLYGACVYLQFCNIILYIIDFSTARPAGGVMLQKAASESQMQSSSLYQTSMHFLVFSISLHNVCMMYSETLLWVHASSNITCTF